MVYKKSSKKKGLQEVVEEVPQGDTEQQNAILYSSLYQLTARLTEICVVNGKPIDEVMDTFTKLYERVEDWYRCAPLKEELKGLLDKLYPDLPGSEPGETLLPKVRPSPYID